MVSFRERMKLVHYTLLLPVTLASFKSFENSAAIEALVTS